MSTSTADRLYTIRYKAADESHLNVRNADVCLHCPTKECTFFCPADVYEWKDEDATLHIAYENCVECGTCRIGCHEANIDWSYPLGGHGITYRFG